MAIVIHNIASKKNELHRGLKLKSFYHGRPNSYEHIH